MSHGKVWFHYRGSNFIVDLECGVVLIRNYLKMLHVKCKMSLCHYCYFTDVEEYLHALDNQDSMKIVCGMCQH